MKFRLLLLVWVLTVPAVMAQKKKKNAASPPPAPFTLQNEADSVSYALGLSFMQSIKGLGLDSLRREAFWQAWQDVQQGQAAKMTPEGAQQFLTTYFQGMQARKAEASRVAGEKFLAENKAKPGVTTLPSGLQYQVVTPGTGPKPTANDRVRVHYRGTLLDGKQFDSSYDRGEPTVFGLTQVIRGWTEALQLMPVGSKWKLFIPAALAYGDRARGADIPPGSTLIFDLELLGIEK